MYEDSEWLKEMIEMTNAGKIYLAGSERWKIYARHFKPEKIWETQIRPWPFGQGNRLTNSA